VEEFLRGLLHDLEQRCAFLRDTVAAIPADPDARDHAVLAYRMVEGIRRNVAQLLVDPSLGAPMLLRNHLQLYKRWNELATLIESYPLPFIERYAGWDRRLTRLCRRLAEQVEWPTPLPLVAAFSSQYYWTMPDFNLICAPPTEGTTLLGLPDLCHELGHILLLHHEATLIGDFVQELGAYIEQEQRRVAAQQRPPEYRRLYNLLSAQWHDAWLREFIADMVATYLVGPAFGWQHVRLCAGRGQDAYHPTLGGTVEHPADEARLRGMLAVLELMGAPEASAQVGALWHGYLAISGETRPADYEVCYPQELIESLARYTVEGCRTLGLRGFDQIVDPPRANDIPALLGKAWERFLTDPQAYADWERQRLQRLWQELGFDPEGEDLQRLA
jgi:hypothetical protein